jgi:hypothetical protein
MKPLGATAGGTAAAAEVQASKGDVMDGFFFAQQTPCGTEREKSGRHKTLQGRWGAA